MSIQLMIALTVTIPLGWAGFIFTLWKWDSRRSEQRAKEREHELKIVSAEQSAQHRNELEAMRARVDSQEHTLLRVQHTITMRLMKALGDSTSAEEELKEAVEENFLNLTEQTTAGFAELRTDYTMLLEKILAIAEQNTGVSVMLGEFKEEVELYYNRLRAKLQDREPQATPPEQSEIPGMVA